MNARLLKRQYALRMPFVVKEGVTGGEARSPPFLCIDPGYFVRARPPLFSLERR